MRKTTATAKRIEKDRVQKVEKARVKKKESGDYIGDWSTVFDRLGELSAKKDKEELAKITDYVSKFRAADLENEALVETLLTVPVYDYRPRFNDQYALMREKCKVEILRRMAERRKR
jgi:hypothetical protein